MAGRNPPKSSGQDPKSRKNNPHAPPLSTHLVITPLEILTKKNIFKETIDAGFNCSLCLGACFVVAPLFFHCMHKMGWVVTIVHHEDVVKKIPSLEDIQTILDGYKQSKPNILACDLDEFLILLEKYHYTKLTSVQKLVAKRMFDAHIDTEIENLELRETKSNEKKYRSKRKCNLKD